MARASKKILKRILFCLAAAVCTAALLFSLTPLFPVEVPGWQRVGEWVGLYDAPERRVTFFDVGQGDCTLVQDGRCAALIDTGSAGSIALEGALRSKGVTKLNTVVITHLHEDHMGNLLSLIECVPIGQIVMRSPLSAPDANHEGYEAVRIAALEQHIPLVSPNTGDTWNIGEYTITCLGLDRPFEEENNRSLALRISDAVSSYLIAGDLETDGEVELLQSNSGDLSVDVMEVPHHGSDTSSSEALLQAVKPQFAVVNDQEGNEALPKQEILQRYRDMGVNVYRTSVNGTVTFSYDEMQKKLVVRAEKN